MKKILLVISVFALFSCKSKEEKAAELIKDEMFKVLFDFESYQPIETKIDSAFCSVYTDSAILRHGYLMNELLKEADIKLEEVKDAQHSMGIWGIDPYSSLDVLRYNEAKEKADKCMKELDFCINLINAESDTIQQLAQNIKPTFWGWKATHKFRCKNKGGDPSIGNWVYYFDEKMKRVVYNEDTEDEDLIKVKGLIKEALDKMQKKEASN